LRRVDLRDVMRAPSIKPLNNNSRNVNLSTTTIDSIPTLSSDIMTQRLRRDSPPINLKRTSDRAARTTRAFRVRRSSLHHTARDKLTRAARH
jgi:hypothetical protein